jgi:hypothetical protein
MSRSTCPWLLVVFALAACAHAPPLAGRYLYEVTCQADVERFDTVEKKKAGEYNLATRPGAEGLIPISVGVLEVCLAGSTVFDPVRSVFYTVVPTRLQQSASGTLSYRILSFSVPGLVMIGQEPVRNEQNDAPELDLAAGRVRIVPSDEPWATYQDLSEFAPDRHAVPNRILESSGGRMLLNLSETGANVFAVADRSSKILVRLRNPPVTDQNGIHLSPGGAFVLVEELKAPDSHAPRTGRLVIHDAQSGGLVKELFAPRIIGSFFRGIAPTGVALYENMESHEFVNLGMSFPADAVLRAPRADLTGPAVFFADR